MRQISGARHGIFVTLATLISAVALCVGPIVAHAETPPTLAKYAGTYKYAGTRDQGVAIVDKAIDKGLSDVNTVMRFLIKKALADHFVESILIRTPSGKIGIKTGELPEATTEIGKAETFKSQDGKMSLKVTHQFDGNKITEISVGEQGTTTTVFELAADGKTLHRSVTFKSDRLDKPVKYKLDYTRR
jgi:hypothetical protein